MIVKGRVHTLNGLVDIKDLKVGDKVIDSGNMPKDVTAINRRTASGIVVFARNGDLVVSDDTVLYTLYGKRKASDGGIMMMSASRRAVNDTVMVCKDRCEGYEIEFDGAGILVENYCLGV